MMNCAAASGLDALSQSVFFCTLNQGYETMMRRLSFFLWYQHVPMDNADFADDNDATLHNAALSN